MRIKIVIKLFALVFCIAGSVFLSLDNISWIHDILSMALCGFVVILLVCLTAMVIHNDLNSTLDYLFMLIGSTLNFTGGLLAIIYYTEPYERYKDSIPAKNLLPLGICAILAGICMLADIIRNITVDMQTM